MKVFLQILSPLASANAEGPRLRHVKACENAVHSMRCEAMYACELCACCMLEKVTGEEFQACLCVDD